MNPRLYVHLSFALLALAAVAAGVRFTVLHGAEVSPLLTSLLFLSGTALLLFGMFSRRLKGTFGSYLGDVAICAAGALTVISGWDGGFDTFLFIVWVVLLGVNVWLTRVAWAHVPEPVRTKPEVLEYNVLKR